MPKKVALPRSVALHPYTLILRRDYELKIDEKSRPKPEANAYLANLLKEMSKLQDDFKKC